MPGFDPNRNPDEFFREPPDFQEPNIAIRYLADPLQSVPLIYGRRRFPGRIIETGQAKWGGVDQKVAFIALSEGEIDSVVAFYIEGNEATDKVTGGKKVSGIFYRVGTVGVDDIETEAEYNADPTTQARSQNEDYRTISGIAFSEIAYAIALKNANSEASPDQDFAFDVRGIKVQKYTAAGAADGSPVWSENALWQVVDLLKSDKHGLGIAASGFDFSVIKPEADYASTQISSTEASTVVTVAQGTATKVCKVASTEGFVRGKAITVGVTSNSVGKIVDDTELELGTAQTQAIDDAVIQKPERLTCNVVIDERRNADRWVREMLQGSRAFVTYDGGKIQLRIERDHAGDPGLLDGGLEVWTSPTDLTNWVETTSAGTVNEETSGGNIYAGTRSARLNRTTTGQLRIAQTIVGGFEPGKWYSLSVAFKQDVATPNGFAIRVQNTSTTPPVIDADGITRKAGTVPARTKSYDTTTGFQVVTFSWLVRSDESDTDSWLFAFYHQDNATNGDLWIDAIEIFGPIAGDFRDSGALPGFGIERGSFSWAVEGKEKETNRVEIQFLNDGGDVGRDSAIADDFEHQKTNRLRTKTIRSRTISDRDQALRVASYELARSRTLGPGARMRVGPAGIATQPGDIVLVSHTVPNWVCKRMRVVRKSIVGLGSQAELFVDLTLEPYEPSIYSDVAGKARGVLSEPTPTLTIAATQTSARMVEISFSVDVAVNTLRRFVLFRDTSASFEPSPITIVGSTNANSIIYTPLDSEIDSTLYFKAWGLTNRGKIVSNEISVTPTRVESSDLDPNADQYIVRTNLILDGDFDDPAGLTPWTKTPAAVSDVFPTSDSGDYANPDNALNKSDATYANGAVQDGNPAKVQTWTFGAGTRTGTVTIRSRLFEITGSGGDQLIEYSLNGGSGYTSLGNSSHTGFTSKTFDVTSQDMSQVIVRATTTASGDDIGGRVSQIYLAESGGTASVANSEATLEGNAANAESSISRIFPVAIDVSRKHLAPGSYVSMTLGAKRSVSGQTPDAALEVWIESRESSWEWLLMSIAAADVENDYSTFRRWANQVPSDVPAEKLQIAFKTTAAAGKGYKFDKAHACRGKTTPLFEPHPSEQTGTDGTIGNFGVGATGAGGSGGGFSGGGGTLTDKEPPPV